MIQRKAFEAGALEEWVVGRDKVATTTTLERHSTFHIRHYLEVVSFHAVGAANGIVVGHKIAGEKL
jgi:hypothetical protein